MGSGRLCSVVGSMGVVRWAMFSGGVDEWVQWVW